MIFHSFVFLRKPIYKMLFYNLIKIENYAGFLKTFLNFWDGWMDQKI
jgi:hypothetical protein